MLDLPNPKPVASARLVAQMRGLMQARNLPDAVADRLADAGITMAAAEDLVPALTEIADAAKTLQLDLEDWLALVDETLSKAKENPKAAPVAVARLVMREAEGRREAAQRQADAEAARRDPGRVVMGASWDSPEAMASKIADARASVLAPMMGVRHEATIGRDLGQTTLAHARAWAGQRGARGLTDAALMQAFVTGRAPGLSGSMSFGQHSTSDFATIAGSAVQIVIGRALEQAPVGLALCAHRITSTDWRARKLASTSAASGLTEVAEGGEISFGTIDGNGETVPAPANLAKAFAATEQLLRNASAGGFDLEAAIARELLAAAQETQRSVLAGAITGNANMADGQPVFSAAHANVAASASAITIASLGTARTAMQRFVDSRGAARPVVPAILLVPPEKQTEAEQIVAQITATKATDANPFAGKLEVIADPGLSGSGTYHWFVLPAPAGTDGLALITLEDMPTPKVESRDAWPNFGMTWRVQWPLAAAFVRPSWYRTQGA